jgi:hypothetical protein
MGAAPLGSKRKPTPDQFGTGFILWEGDERALSFIGPTFLATISAALSVVLGDARHAKA